MMPLLNSGRFILQSVAVRKVLETVISLLKTNFAMLEKILSPCVNMKKNSARVKNLILLTVLWYSHRLGHEESHWIVFLQQYPFISKKNANNQIPLKLSFDAPFYKISLRTLYAKPHYSSVF